MLINVQNISLNVILNQKEILDKIPVVFLHGFTGNREDWNFFKNNLPNGFTPIFIDLLGHGLSSAPENEEVYSADSQVSILEKIFLEWSLKKIILVGYSMGGRLALAYTIRFPRNVSALFLESTSFGIEDEIERAERVVTDKILAERIINSTIEEFIRYWVSIPLFNTITNLPPQKQKRLIQRKIISNNKIGLKNSLLGFSSGKMDNYFPIINKIRCKTHLVAGELDEKYSIMMKRGAQVIPNSELSVIKNCGHNTHFEKPEEFLKLLNKFLLNI